MKRKRWKIGNGFVAYRVCETGYAIESRYLITRVEIYLFSESDISEMEKGVTFLSDFNKVMEIEMQANNFDDEYTKKGEYYVADAEIRINSVWRNFTSEDLEIATKIMRKVERVTEDMEDPCLLRKLKAALKLLGAYEIKERSKGVLDRNGNPITETVYVIGD